MLAHRPDAAVEALGHLGAQRVRNRHQSLARVEGLALHRQLEPGFGAREGVLVEGSSRARAVSDLQVEGAVDQRDVRVALGIELGAIRRRVEDGDLDVHRAHSGLALGIEDGALVSQQERRFGHGWRCPEQDEEGEKEGGASGHAGHRSVSWLDGCLERGTSRRS
jgi:hypothetical protein